MIGAAGGGPVFDGVPRPRPRDGFPAAVFLRVVAGLAQPCRVAEAGGPAGMPGHHVVVMPDGRITIGCAAGVITGLDKAAQP